MLSNRIPRYEIIRIEFSNILLKPRGARELFCSIQTSKPSVSSLRKIRKQNTSERIISSVERMYGFEIKWHLDTAEMNSTSTTGSRLLLKVLSHVNTHQCIWSRKKGTRKTTQGKHFIAPILCCGKSLLLLFSSRIYLNFIILREKSNISTSELSLMKFLHFMSIHEL